MAEGKRYYWLKLYDDFFSSRRIKKLRKMAGGDTYTIIYLKLQLLAMKSEGVLRWDGLEDSVADELALDLDESPDDVKVTLAYLMSCGLAETSDDVSFFFPYAVSNTGSENASAQRVREYRARAKALQCNADVTEVKRVGNAEIDTRDRDKSKKLDITVSNDTVRRTQEVQRIITAWNLLGLTQIIKVNANTVRGKLLNARISEYGVDDVLKAIDKVKESKFLKGDGKNGWVITFDWFIKPSNFAKVLEGNYDDREGDNGRAAADDRDDDWGHLSKITDYRHQST